MLLSNIVKMQVPQGIEVEYYIIVDNPSMPRDGPSLVFPGIDNVNVVNNEENIGAHASRNRGLEAGSGDYVLFLDDDVEPLPGLLQSYKEAIQTNPDSIGFVGVASFPPPINSFTRGLVLSDILTFWEIALTHKSLAWGVTANLMVRRSAIGSIRFRTAFPKGGGGEDIDFCLRIVEKEGRWLTSEPKARVRHPWWNGGSRSYRRFARWAYGDSQLAKLYPDYKYRNFPNLVETLIVGSVAWSTLSLFGLVHFVNLALWIGMAFLVEFATEAARTRNKPGATPITVIESDLVRLSNDLGRIAGNSRRGHFAGITERFDYFVTWESLEYERSIARTKFTGYVIAAMIAYILNAI